MLANRVKETFTSTVAAVTLLGAATNFVSFNTMFGTSRRFYYWIVDDTNNVWECGVGYLTTSTNLVRETVLATSTTPAGTATALTLSAGTKDIFCAAPDMLTFAAPTDISTSGVYDGQFSAHYVGGTTRTNGMTATRYLITPHKVEFGGLVTNIAIDITTASATGVARTGIYDVSENGMPGILLAETAEYSTTATGEVALALGTAVYLRAGWHYIVTNCDENFTIAGTDYSNAGATPFGMRNPSSPYTYAYTSNESYPSGGMPSDYEARAGGGGHTFQYGQHPAVHVLERT